MSDDIIAKLSPKRAARIEQILDAAEESFAQSGFHGAGISGIAQSCGISVGHLYHYVESKEALITAVVERELGRQKARLEELESVIPGSLIGELVTKVAESILQETDLFRTVLNFEMLAEAQRNPKIANILQRHDAEMRERFCKILQRSELPSPEMKTELIFTIFSGLPARALRHPEQERSIVIETMLPVLRKILDRYPAAGEQISKDLGQKPLGPECT